MAATPPACSGRVLADPTPTAPPVLVPAGHADRHWRVDERHVFIKVSDQGMGVPESALETIFDPFVRGTKVQGEGYGLGLAITRRAIQALGGTVSAANKAEGGFCVTITIHRHHHG